MPGKETVVRKHGEKWSFHLPEGHEIIVDHEHGSVTLSMPNEGTTYELAGIDETAEEVVVQLGAEVANHTTGPAPGGLMQWPHGYPLPQIQDEDERLHRRWGNAGLPEQEYIAVAQGADPEAHFARMRARLRKAGA